MGQTKAGVGDALLSRRLCARDLVRIVGFGSLKFKWGCRRIAGVLGVAFGFWFGGATRGFVMCDSDLRIWSMSAAEVVATDKITG